MHLSGNASRVLEYTVGCVPSDEWLQHLDTCYYISDTWTETYSEADMWCHARGGALLTVKDRKIHHFLQGTCTCAVALEMVLS